MDDMHQADIDADPREQRAAVEERLRAIYTDVSRKRDEWVEHRARSGVERLWARARELYDGKDAGVEVDGLEDTLRNGPRKVSKSGRQRRSTVVVNIVAPKVEAVVARESEILLPVDDRNWALAPTPDPELAKAARADGVLVDPASGQEVMPLSDAAKGKMEAARASCEAMESQIADVLSECGYNAELRKVIRDRVLLGTGILKGPSPVRRRSSSYTLAGDAYVKVRNESIRPASVRLAPDQVYFDPACGNDHQRGSGVLERREITRRELRDLIGLPGYDDIAIAEVLAEEPSILSCADGKVMRVADRNRAYELWEFHLEVEPDDFAFLRAQSGGQPLERALAVERAVLVMVNDRVIGALPCWSDEDWPYDVVVYTEQDDTPHGKGLPHRLESQQRVVTAAWRQLMDNAGAAAGGQLVMLRNCIEPADGNWQVSPMKIWLAKEDMDDVRKAFNMFEFSAHTEELLAIVDAALRMADQESNTPLLLQGDQGSAPDTVGGTTLLFNAASSPLRHRVKIFDDKITTPHLRRYYDWMMNDPAVELEAKGDYEVTPRGSSVLVERDAQNVAAMNMAGLSQHPIYGPLIAMRAARSLRTIVKSMRLPVEDWVPTDEEIEAKAKQDAKAAPPQDPKIATAQIAAEAKMAELADRKEEREFRAEIEAANAQERRASLAYNASREQGEYEIAMTQEQNERDIALAKLANERNMSVEQLQQAWGLKLMEINHERDLFNGEARLKTQMGTGI